MNNATATLTAGATAGSGERAGLPSGAVPPEFTAFEVPVEYDILGGMQPVANPARNPDRTWPDTIRCELIDGVFFDMSLAANRFHQHVSIRIEQHIGAFLKGKPCVMYHAPFDMILPDHPDEEVDEVRTVVQPDILVVCDRVKLTDKGCPGAPDWIIDILSPYTSKKDLIRQRQHQFARSTVSDCMILSISQHTYFLWKASHR